MVIIETPKSSKHKIIEVGDYLLPKIDGRIEKSQLYLGCILFLMEHFISQCKYDSHVLLSRKEVSIIIGLGNKEYRSQNYFDIIDEHSTEGIQKIASNIFSCVYKKTNDILRAAHDRGFLYFEETYYRYDQNREATEEESKDIKEARESVAERYGIKNYKQVFFHQKRKEIIKKVDNILGYSAYDILKFRVDDQLQNSYEYLNGCKKTEYNKLKLNGIYCEIVRSGFFENDNNKRKDTKAKKLLDDIGNHALIDTIDYAINRIIKIQD